MPPSLADLICAYWRNPDVVRDFVFYYPGSPATRRIHTPPYDAKIEEEPGGSGQAIAVVTHPPHVVSCVVSRAEFDVGEEGQEILATHLARAMELELARLLIVAAPSPPARPAQWIPWGSVFSPGPIYGDTTTINGIQMMYGCASGLVSRAAIMADAGCEVESLADAVLREAATTTAKPGKPKPWAPIEGLKTIFHPGGHFRSPDGRRFDYVFPELLERPDIPWALLPSIQSLQEDALFSGRLGRDRSPIDQWEWCE